MIGNQIRQNLVHTLSLQLWIAVLHRKVMLIYPPLEILVDALQLFIYLIITVILDGLNDNGSQRSDSLFCMIPIYIYTLQLGKKMFTRFGLFLCYAMLDILYQEGALAHRHSSLSHLLI